MSTPRTTNLTELPLGKAILTMALPAALTVFVESLYYLVDTYWVGKLGAKPLASISATSFLLWMMASFSAIGETAGNALTAQVVGGKRDAELPELIRHVLLTTVLVSLVVMGLVGLTKSSLFSWFGLEADVAAGAEDYLAPWLIGLPLVYAMYMLSGVFRGVGDARTPLMMNILMVLANVVLDPLFIFGWGPVPAMGVAGAAWASLLCHSVGLLVAVPLLIHRGLWPRFSLHLPWTRFRKIVEIGLPIAANGFFFSGIYVFLTKIIALFGSAPVAAVGLSHRMESVPWHFCVGFSVAAASLTGQYLGAGRPDDAERAVWKCSAIAGIFVSTYIVVLLLFAEEIVSFFIQDAEVIAISAQYLRIIGVSWFIGFFEVVLEGGFSGSGNTLPPLLIGMPLTLARIPLAYGLAVWLEWGVVGVWWAIASTTVLKGAMMALWFKRGYWKRFHPPAQTSPVA